MRQNITEILCNMTEELIHSGLNGRTAGRKLTELVDNILVSAFEAVVAERGETHGNRLGLALVAVGGYGRREFSPYSDIDIMVLAKTRGRAMADTAQAVLYRFWDKGLNISHCFRTQQECVEDAMADIQTRTSLIESRFLAGDRALFEEYMRDVYPRILFKKKREFVGDMLREIDKRHKTYGNSVYLLEPNVKEGWGGLRDIHSLSWLARVVLHISGQEELEQLLPGPDYRRFIRAYDFLLTVRLCLHTSAKRKNDILSFEFQDRVAELAGFRDTKRFLAEEIMMRLYYRNARFLMDTLARVMRICGRHYFSLPSALFIKRISADFYISKNELIVKDRGIFRNSDKIFEAFLFYAGTGRRFSEQVRERIKARYLFINKKTRSSRKAVSCFLEILRSSRVYETLREMQDTGILDRFIPEFGRLRHLVIFEPYHRYTVDEHTLIAIRNLEALRQTKHKKLLYLSEIMKKVKPEVMYLSVLLHDIGKGVSRRHEEAGYKMLKGILERFGIGSEDRSRIEFLVKNHISLAKFALARDTDAPETVVQLAEMVENEENLTALYLMTYADMTAVNPHFWTEWKAYLLHDIYTRTRDHMRGTTCHCFDPADKQLKAFAEGMTERYLISHTDEAIREDYLLICNAVENKVSVAIKERPDATAEISVATSNKSGLFSMIVEALTRNGLNICRARLYTGESGIVIDKFLISNWKELWWLGVEEQVEEDIRNNILMPSDMNSHQRCGSIPFASKRFETFAEIDNETSESHTIFELFLTDRLGLLYDISLWLYKYKVDITSAIINTEDGVAHDVFYLQYKGGKLNAEVIPHILGGMERWSQVDSEQTHCLS
jgi:[protein-PII] uridylyltransferase